MAAQDSGEIIRSSRNPHGEAGDKNFDQVRGDSFAAVRPSKMLNVSQNADAFSPATASVFSKAIRDAARLLESAECAFAFMRSGSRTRADGEELVTIKFSSFKRLRTPSSAAS